MQLNGLTNNLKNGDKTLSTSYLQHIVELLRKEVEAIETQLNQVSTDFYEHDEKQQEEVDTVDVNATNVIAEEVTADVVNGGAVYTPKVSAGVSMAEINFLQNAIEAITDSFKINGHEVITDETFQGPFSYKGLVTELPETADAGDVYIVSDTVYIYNGTDWDSFDMPIGTVSQTEFYEYKTQTNQAIDDLDSRVVALETTVPGIREDLDIAVSTIGIHLNTIDEALANKLDANPVDDTTYVRKNDEWIPLSDAANTVKHTVQIDEETQSVIDNSTEGVSISSPKVDIVTEEFKVNGSDVPVAADFGLTKTETEPAEKYWYNMEYYEDPSARTRNVNMSLFASGVTQNQYHCRARLNQNCVLSTKDYTYVKAFTTNWGNRILYSQDKNGKIKVLPTSREFAIYPNAFAQASMIAFNPEYCPEGFENKMWLVSLKNAEGTTVYQDRRIFEYDNGEYVGQDSIYWNDYLATPVEGFSVTGWSYMTSGGKALRNKNIKRICYVGASTASGATFALIIGGYADDPLDEFDMKKSIFVTLPAPLPNGIINLYATDSAWYALEDNTGRIMKIQPNGIASEITLSNATLRACVANGFEYIDKNGRPAVAFSTFVAATSGALKHIFIEEGDTTTCKEIDVPNMVYGGWSSSFYRFIENDYYIFWTSFCGANVGEGAISYDTAANHCKLVAYDKRSLTSRTIDFYDNTSDAYARIDMALTKDKAIYFLCYSSTITSGQIKYVLNEDYSVYTPSGSDVGNIEFHNVSYPPSLACYSGMSGYDLHTMHSASSTLTSGYIDMVRLAAVNDDGYMLVVSASGNNIAIMYGNGIVYSWDIGIGGAGPATAYRAITDQPVTPSDLGQLNVRPTKHGWIVQTGTNNDILVYVSPVYTADGEITTDEPKMTTFVGYPRNGEPARNYWDYYGYLLTYDDYSKRKLVMREALPAFSYKNLTDGLNIPSACYKEKINNEKTNINLTYKDEVVSSVEI